MHPTTSPSALYPLDGVIAIQQTPFDPDGNLDLESFDAGVEDRIAAGVEALIYPAVASEVGKLHPQERAALLARLAETAQGRVRIIAGASSEDPVTAQEVARQAAELGCAGILVQVPDSLMGDVDDLRGYFQGIAAAGPPMLMIQDLDWRGRGLPIATILRLFEDIPQFRCIKVETALAGMKYSEILSATGGELNVSGGWASSQLIEALDRGLHATACGGHHRVYREITLRYRAGDRQGARDVFERLLPVLAFTNQHIDISNRFNKMCAVRRGIYRHDTIRSPEVEMDSHHLAIAREMVERLTELEDSILSATEQVASAQQSGRSAQ